jgi:hypothetical protein
MLDSEMNNFGKSRPEIGQKTKKAARKSGW